MPSGQHHLCGGVQVAKDPVPGQLCAGGGYGGGPRRCQGELHQELFNIFNGNVSFLEITNDKASTKK